LEIAAQLQLEGLVSRLGEGRGGAVVVDHVGHFRQAPAALRLATAGAVNGGGRQVAARSTQVVQGRMDRGIVQGIADANEQKISPAGTGGHAAS
tara:strand:- start:964 stop:1245 length:282 start_codon:yes stop_codon:yes gene_type:complete